MPKRSTPYGEKPQPLEVKTPDQIAKVELPPPKAERVDVSKPPPPIVKVTLREKIWAATNEVLDAIILSKKYREEVMKLFTNIKDMKWNLLILLAVLVLLVLVPFILSLFMR